MMKTFKEFLKEYFLIDQEPVHGRHAQEEPANIFKEPVHGEHSRVEESYDDEVNFRNKNHNPHLGERIHEHSEKIGTYETKDKNKRAAVRFYTNDSKGINNYHRDIAHGREPFVPSKRMYDPKTNRVGFVEQIPLIEKHTPHLDSAINESKMKHNAVLFHGAGWNPKSDIEKGNGKIKIPSYTSTSLDPGIAHDYADEKGRKEQHVFAIHVKKGQPGLHLGRNSKLTEHGHEHEVLLPRNLKLNVNKVPEKYGSLHIWHATVD